MMLTRIWAAINTDACGLVSAGRVSMMLTRIWAAINMDACGLVGAGAAARRQCRNDDVQHGQIYNFKTR